MSDAIHTVSIYTLGCKVNQYESEAIAECFAAKGFTLQAPTAFSDVYVINTCTVTAESDRKARQFIRRVIHRNPNAYVLITGCYAQVFPDEVASIVGVDYVCGNAEKLSVVDVAIKLIEGGKKQTAPIVRCTPPDAFGFEEMQITRFDRTRAYVKIEDGCESHCTYCIIPSARGKIRSKNPEDVLNEVRTLTENGCREIVLTGIETASYGKDFSNYSLADLLCEIDKIPNVGRIRLGSLDPSMMKAEFVNRVASLRSLAPHFHLSMQSGSDRILAKMKRKYNTKIAREGIERLRKAIPGVQFTTDMIVGFPGESEQDFEQSMQFVREIGFLMVHVFPYSQRAGTPAATMEDQISQQIKHQRVALLSKEAEKARLSQLDAKVGQFDTVLVEGYKNGEAYGHTPDFCEVSVAMKRPSVASLLPIKIISHDGTRCFAQLC